MRATRVLTGPPDFVGVGAQRAGTTWWFELLLQHPAIETTRRGNKEVHHFDRFGSEPMTADDVEAYHRLFPRVDGIVRGEWTPRYMVDAWTPRLLARAAPDARLLVLLRDPIERYRSGVLLRAIRTPDHALEVMASDAIHRGRYASQLRHLHHFFDPARILVLQYERCVAEPEAQYRRTLQFLGLDDHVPGAVDLPRGETTEADKQPLWDDLAIALRTALEPEVRELRHYAPDIDVSLWPNFADAG